MKPFYEQDHNSASIGSANHRGAHQSNLANTVNRRVDSDLDRSGRNTNTDILRGVDNDLDCNGRNTNTTGTGMPRHSGNNIGTDGPMGKAQSVGSGGGEETRKKPGLMDRLNPKKDADGDGKPGFMK